MFAYTLLKNSMGLSKPFTLFLCFLIIMRYQHLVALLVPNTIPMPSMDQQTFLSNPNSNVHFMNSTKFREGCISVDDVNFDEVLKTHPKLRYKVKILCGDFYYQEMTLEETKQKLLLSPSSEDKVLKSQSEIDMYIRDNLNKKFPLDGPLIRAYLQNIEVAENGEPVQKSMIIWKFHHCMCDGISAIALLLAFGKELNPSYFMKTKLPNFFERLFLRVTFPFHLPAIAKSTMLARQDVNCITKGRLRGSSSQLTGRVNISSAPSLDLAKVKEASKKIGVTINDMIMCAASTSLHKHFREQGDQSKDILMVIPANIRFKMYQSMQDLKIENKFTTMGFKVPLCQTMKEGYKPIQRVTSQIKKSFGYIYAMYAFIFWTSSLIPRICSHHTVESISQKYTIAFSNTPGPVKQIEFMNKKTGEVKTVS
mmetsp:Transcript_2010/g.3556  ORF Transcript_2010/g.3556 Transcript_2010/m.3556 type:complete len:424 (+) Transcript_2010:269-1540(+)